MIADLYRVSAALHWLRHCFELLWLRHAFWRNCKLCWILRATLAAQQLRICLQCGRPGFDPRIGKMPWRRAGQATPVFLPGEFHGQRSLTGCSPCGRKEWTERLTFSDKGRQESVNKTPVPSRMGQLWGVFYPFGSPWGLSPRSQCSNVLETDYQLPFFLCFTLLPCLYFLALPPK